MPSEVETTHETGRKQTVENVARDLGLNDAQAIPQFVNSICLPCCACGKDSKVQCEEPLIWMTKRPGLGTAVSLTCCNCVAVLLICFRVGKVIHIEQVTGPSDRIHALERAEKKLKKGPATPTEIKTTSASMETTLSWCQKGEKSLETGQYSAAITCFDRALAICPKAARVWGDKGRALVRLGNAVEAVACYTRSLGINPLDPVVWFNKGTSLQRMGRLEEAVSCFEHSLQIDETDPDVWCNKAIALHSLGRIEEELSCFDKALKLNSDHVDAWFNKGCTLAQNGKPEEGLKCFERVVALRPMDADAWFYKAATLLSLKNGHEAATSLERFIDVAEPGDARVEQARGLLRQLRATKRSTPHSEAASSRAAPFKASSGSRDEVAKRKWQVLPWWKRMFARKPH